MSWKDTTIDFEDGNGEVPVKSIMVCDYCKKEIEWWNVQRDYDNPDEEMIQIAKDIDGWASIGIHHYENDPENPASIEVEACTYHACPECRKEFLRLVEDEE